MKGVMEQSCSPHGGQEARRVREEGTGTKQTVKGRILNDLIPPNEHRILKFLVSPNRPDHWAMTPSMD
jgi:hypothetical protein